MTAAEFKNEALAVPGAIENHHHAHPDFRVRGKIFATLGYPDATSAMVKLTPEQQRDFVTTAPDVFRPANGAWGKAGSTTILLPAARKSVVRRAVRTAAANLAAKQPRPARFNP